jgi:cyclopropane-fatty-acyl-phospholipid synthase
MMSGLKRGELRVSTPGGSLHVVRGAGPGPAAAIELRRHRALRRIVLGGDLGFAQAYIDGDLDSPDLTAVIALACANPELDGNLGSQSWLVRLRRIYHFFHSNTRRGSRRNIAAHYDLGNDFFALWLDPSMTYSSAIFAEPDYGLEQAQRHKLRLLADRLSIGPGSHVLEIGCGWGAFAAYLAGERGCRVTAITVSREQHEAARRRLFEAGLAERADVQLRDYRDVDGRYDRIVSVEMLEAVGEPFWPVFFSTLRERLVPGGLAGLQAITIADRFFAAYRGGVDFIQRHVFPGGVLPSPAILHRLAADAGLAWRADEGYGQHYARTLKEWRGRFDTAWPRIQALGFDERFARLWRYYLCYCEAGFAAGRIDVSQIVLARR